MNKNMCHNPYQKSTIPGIEKFKRTDKLGFLFESSAEMHVDVKRANNHHQNKMKGGIR